ncbi:MAG: response regulator transcription factor [Polyangiaceae bacterium]
MQSSLAALLGSELDFSIAGQSSSPEDGGRDAELMLWDTGPQPSAARTPSLERTPTLALVRDEESALDLWRAGALGVLLRSADGERLLVALRAVAAGLGVFEPALLRALLSARTASPDGLLLTPREAEVLALMAEGLSNKLIADRLKISDHTAKFHVNSILNKLGAETRTEAVVLAARRGLLML